MHYKKIASMKVMSGISVESVKNLMMKGLRTPQFLHIRLFIAQWEYLL